MSPTRIVGLLLIVAGAAVLALGGVSYTRERESVEIGNLELSAERKGFIPPVAGVIMIAAGAVFVLIPRRRP